MRTTSPGRPLLLARRAAALSQRAPLPRALSQRAPLPRALGLATLVAVAIGCTTPTTPPPASLPPSRLAVTDAGPLAAAETPDAASAPPPHELPPRRGVAGSTRGTIACGDRRCDAAKEKCVTLPEPAWACVPRDVTHESYNDIFLCDDGTDCPSGQTCCMSFASANTAYVCATRREGEDCRMEVCEPGGARCPAGQACTGGFCQPSSPPGPLCGRAPCTGDTPYCLWSGGKGKCASAAEAQEADGKLMAGGEVAVLRCTQSRDCGAGQTCCTGMTMGPKQSYCSLNCDLVNSMKYCASDADCPSVMGTKLRCRRPDADLPPWSRLCVSP